MDAPERVPTGFFWSGETILANPGVVEPFNEFKIDCNSYTLRMGDCYFRTAESESGDPPTKTFLKEKEAFTIPPGQFAYLLSKESIHVPRNAMAFISMRTSVKFQGLINVSGFHVDPGYNGKLLFAVYNASPLPVHLCENDNIFKIWFASLDRESDDKYVYTKPGIADISNDLVRGMSKEILSLQRLNEKITEVENSVNLKLQGIQPALENLSFIWRAITLAVIIALVIALLTATLPTLWSYVQPKPATEVAPAPTPPPQSPAPPPAKKLP